MLKVGYDRRATSHTDAVHPAQKTDFLPSYTKGTILPAFALNIGIGHKLWGSELSNIDIITRETGLGYLSLMKTQNADQI